MYKYLHLYYILKKHIEVQRKKSSVRPSSITGDCWKNQCGSTSGSEVLKSLGSPRVMTCKKVFYALCKIKLFCHGEMHK
jgi:hypothetical protein